MLVAQNSLGSVCPVPLTVRGTKQVLQRSQDVLAPGPAGRLFRINFRGDKGLGEVRSEWFKVGDSVNEEKKFLKFIDNAVFAIDHHS